MSIPSRLPAALGSADPPHAHTKTGRPTRSTRLIAAGALGILLTTLVACETTGWFFLADPVQQLLSRSLGRSVTLSRSDAGAQRLRLQLIGSPRLTIGALRIANPPWSRQPNFVQARDITLQTTWGDLWRTARGGDIVLQSVSAGSLIVAAERPSAGRASWLFEIPAPPSSAPATDAPVRALRLHRLDVTSGRFTLKDTPLALDLTGTITSGTGTSTGAPTPAPTRAAARYAWTLDATGTYRSAPISLQARAGMPGAEAWSGATPLQVPLSLQLRTRDVRLDATGQIHDPLGLHRIESRFQLSGPSLAEIGAPLGVNLPATPPLRLQGTLNSTTSGWIADITDARIGRSELAGRFEYLTTTPVPRLNGLLRGRSLRLQDLGPTLGTDGTAAQADPAVKAPPATRLLPDRQLDLPSLAGMDADIEVRLDQVDLGHAQLKDIRPLSGRVLVSQGVLTLDKFQAGLAQGQVSGRLEVDGRTRPARWDLALQARRVRLEDWIRQNRPDGQPPFVSGRLALGLNLSGRGNSTAAFLGDAQGRLWAVWSEGRMSHLAVEAAGLDLAQSFGVWLSGDESLPVGCGAIDTGIRHGTLVPKVLLADTPDSTLWAEGRISLASETLDLTLQSRPKDFSPLSLRSPIHLRGTFAAPAVSLDKAGLLTRALPAALLSMINPLATLIPLADIGDDAGSAQALGQCRALTQQFTGSARS